MDTTRILFFFGLTCAAVAALLTSPPKIVKQPTQEEILFQVAEPGEIDEPFIIECEAEGEPAPKFRWFKNGKPLEHTSFDNRISQKAGRGTLVVDQPRDEDLGQYQCFAYNEWGTAASNSVFVRRAELNDFKLTDGEQVVRAEEGKPFKLTCEPPDGHPKPKVYWMLQGDQGQLKTINNSRMTLDPDGNLWFSNVTRYDAIYFAYICTANSIFRNEYKFGNKIYLEVTPTGIAPTLNRHEPVRQYTSRMVMNALKGKMVELYCIYGGTPVPQISWKMNGRSIHVSRGIILDAYGRTLVIRKPTYEHQGTYTCEVSNGVGTAQSYSILLNIEAAPFFTIEPEIQKVAEGQTAEIKCEAGGTPEPKVTWIHNGKPIEQAEANPRRQVTANTIVITNVVKTDTGNYGCNASSSIGYVYKDVYINVQSFPKYYLDKNSSDSKSTKEIIPDKKRSDSKSTKEIINNIIISSICGALMILLIIIGIWKRCWIPSINYQASPQLPTTEPSDPFYLNLLFRKECDAEIEEIEQHHYEEIERPYEEIERPYKELERPHSEGIPIYEEI